MKLTIIATIPIKYNNNISNNKFLNIAKREKGVYSVGEFEEKFNNDELNVEGNWLRVLEVDVEIVGCK